MFTGKKIIDKENEHALDVGSTFSVKMMKNYYDFYLKCDVLMLADVFEKCKNSGFKGYQLCLAHYLSTPAVSWYAILNMEKVELELI